jgi:hypothetical protein
MMTIYQLVDEVCARDFPVLAMLTEAKYTDFVNRIYDDVMIGDNPQEINEDKLFDYIQEMIAQAISDWILQGER